MNRKIVMVMFICASACANRPLLAADPWKGAKVLPRSTALRLRIQGQFTGTVAEIAWPASVQTIDGQWLELRDDGGYSVPPAKGWVRKNDVLGLDKDGNAVKTNGIPAHDDPKLFYTDRILAEITAMRSKGKTCDPAIAGLYWLRGIYWEGQNEVEIAVADFRTAIAIACGQQPNNDGAPIASCNWSVVEYERSAGPNANSRTSSMICGDAYLRLGRALAKQDISNSCGDEGWEHHFTQAKLWFDAARIRTTDVPDRCGRIPAQLYGAWGDAIRSRYDAVRDGKLEKKRKELETMVAALQQKLDTLSADIKRNNDELAKNCLEIKTNAVELDDNEKRRTNAKGELQVCENKLGGIRKELQQAYRSGAEKTAIVGRYEDMQKEKASIEQRLRTLEVQSDNLGLTKRGLEIVKNNLNASRDLFAEQKREVERTLETPKCNELAIKKSLKCDFGSASEKYLEAEKANPEWSPASLGRGKLMVAKSKTNAGEKSTHSGASIIEGINQFDQVIRAGSALDEANRERANALVLLADTYGAKVDNGNGSQPGKQLHKSSVATQKDCAAGSGPSSKGSCTPCPETRPEYTRDTDPDESNVVLGILKRAELSAQAASREKNNRNPDSLETWAKALEKQGDEYFRLAGSLERERRKLEGEAAVLNSTAALLITVGNVGGVGLQSFAKQKEVEAAAKKQSAETARKTAEDFFEFAADRLEWASGLTLAIAKSNSRLAQANVCYEKAAKCIADAEQASAAIQNGRPRTQLAPNVKAAPSTPRRPTPKHSRPATRNSTPSYAE